MDKKSERRGRVVTPANANPWPHEQRVAKILALAGYYVEFIPETSIRTPDIYLGRTNLARTMYEIKSPVSDKISAVERNLTRALAKCPNVIFDSSRMKVRDDQILKELVKRRRAGKGMKKLLFINKRGMVIDIEALI